VYGGRSSWLVQLEVIKSSGWEGSEEAELIQNRLGKNTQQPGSSFHKESSGGDFGKSCLIMSGLKANC